MNILQMQHSVNPSVANNCDRFLQFVGEKGT